MPELKQESSVSPAIEYPSIRSFMQASNYFVPVERKIVSMPTGKYRFGHAIGDKKLMGPIPENRDGEAGRDNTNGRKGTTAEYPRPAEFKEINQKSSVQKGGAYLRLTLHVEDGKMTLIDVHKLDGPLIIEDRIDGEYAYEVTLSTRRIASGSIMDVGVNRSFPNPYGVPGQEGHFIVELPSYEFDVDIPAKDLSISLLPKVEIGLYEVKSHINKIIGEKSFTHQYKNKLHEVSRLKGIDITGLSQRSQTEIYELFRHYTP
ncbi:MAG TPA: hypothetical protein VD710_07120 [Nitrososphaeraceae archaeon]|nr:hypothetical protein [Nitrososphaeraceae archaeon]